MAVVRENILNSADVANDFLNAVVALDQTMSGLRASDLLAFVQANNLNIQMAGIDQDLSIYDIFVFWHLVAMRIPLSVGNAAHSGPIFLPWHRLYMIRLEEFMQQVTGDDTVALPYWDWAADGELATGSQWLAEVWDPAILGESRGAVRSGPLSQIRVRLVEDAQTGRLVSIDPRPLERRAGFGVSGLPDRGDVAVAMAADRYDAAPWGRGAGEHRDLLEGWWGFPAQMHNRVHVWVGGDMGPGTSPNDPVFFLNHCFTDRIWQDWMDLNGMVYQPGANQGPQGHRLNSQMVALIGQSLTPADVLDASQWYSYDSGLIV